MRRLLSITIRFLAVVTLESSCSSLPAAPQGNTCVVDVANLGADCVPISAAIRRGSVSVRDATSFVPFSQMDNWIAFSPSTWANIQTYIGKLKILAQQKCSQ